MYVFTCTSYKLADRRNSKSANEKQARKWTQTEMGPPGAVSDEEPTCPRRRLRATGREAPLEEGMATPSRVPIWRGPRTEEPGGYSP